jgi:hypothetical protein
MSKLGELHQLSQVIGVLRSVRGLPIPVRRPDGHGVTHGSGTYRSVML